MHTFNKVMLPQSVLKGDVSSVSLLGCKDNQWREITTSTIRLCCQSVSRANINNETIRNKMQTRLILNEMIRVNFILTTSLGAAEVVHTF